MENEQARIEADGVEVDPAALCPSCSRFVGPKTRCPFCGASIHARMSVRLFRWGAMALAVFGLLFIYLWARNKGITRVRLADVVETMNMAYVRVEGTVGRVSAGRDGKGRIEYMHFDLDDGTAVARVKAHRHVAGALETRDLLPRRGDRMVVAGSIRIEAEGRIVIFLQTADHVIRTPAEILEVPLGEVDLTHVGKTVSVFGRVGSVYEPKGGSRQPYKVLLRKEGATAMLTVWSRSWAALVEKGLREGVTVTARVTVGEYRGRVQLLLEGEDDLRLEGTAASSPAGKEGPGKADVSPSERITRKNVGEIVTVRGVVTEVARFRHGVRLRVRQGEETVEIYVKNVVATRAETLEGLRAGGRVRVRGRVTEYQGRLQVTPLSAEEVVVEAPGEGVDETLRAPAKRAAASLTRDDEGCFVILVGKVASAREIKKGTLLKIDDGSGKSATVVVWDRVKKELRNPAVLTEGKRI
ncbi:MAG: OB-fold nucleic acid binding domain-containing protein, partial [Planctomycetota bacterium]